MRRVFLIAPTKITFIDRDEAILKKHCIVSRYNFKGTDNPIYLLFRLLKLVVVSMLQVSKCDIVYCWFSGYHSVLPSLFGRLFGKKVVVVVAGYDAVSIPSIQFGVFWKRNAMTWCARNTYLWADTIITVDKSLEKGINRYADPTGKGYVIGVRNFVSNVKAAFYNIPFGFDTGQWKPNPSVQRNQAVLSIGLASNLRTFKRKGFDLLIEVAKFLPDTRFTIVGLSEGMLEYARGIKSDNVELVGKVPNHKLPDYFSSYKVFAQLSMSEGQPNTLCEAMACGCIPVGSDVNGIPVSIGDCGFVVEKRDVGVAVEAIRKALTAPPELGLKARERIVNNYPSEQRERLLLPLIQ